MEAIAAALAQCFLFLLLYLMVSHTCLGQIELPLSTTSNEKSQKSCVSFLISL
jgi:hypothetical protein